jgi:uncharacterized protein (DUF2147 family)
MSQGPRPRLLARWTRLAAIVAALAPFTGAALAQTPPSPEGIWYTKNNESIIRVHACPDDASLYCGTLVWMKDPNNKQGQPKTDTLNRDPAKKDRPMLGSDILMEMKAETDRWRGKAYNPEDGKVYDITFKMAPGDNNTADLRGCVLGFLCQTEVFNRATDVPGGDPTLASAASVHKHKGHKDVKASAQR